MSSTNFDACLGRIQGDDTLWRTGGTDIFGHPITNVSDLFGITYRLCVSQCGAGPESFSFPAFSTQFSSFMLPFLALTAQLPFGATNSADNFSTIALTIGSPTLAIFSLIITVLNSRWLKRRFARISYPNTNHAVTVLNNLQQSLLRVEQDSNGCPLLASLIVLPQNDQWWQRAAGALMFTHTWSMVNIATVMWAIIAYFLTVTSMDPRSFKVIGPAVACAWLWLLPLVVGWFQTSPNCDEAMLKMKVVALNEMVFIAVGDKESTDLPKLAREGAVIHLSLSSDNFETISSDFDVFDESRSPPFYNYSRVFSWARSAEKVASSFEAASFRASRREPVTGSAEWINSDYRGLDVHPENRVGNAVDVREYIDLGRQPVSRWGPEVWTRFCYSAVAACIFQWISSGSAVFAAWMTPTVGLGCHSASFILYGALSTLSFFMILLGEVLQQFYHPTTSHLRLQESIGFFALIIAWSNAVIFISVDILAFANIMNNCYCASTVMGLGSDLGYNILIYNPSMRILNWWVGAVIVSTVSAIVFWFSIFTLGR
ncbi:hypothetical protein C8J56DRAFT_861283 [Mycena floridula]|nr:hypothetical protein C8J56DRAFT_861283 [Mycena floridula]